MTAKKDNEKHLALVDDEPLKCVWSGFPGDERSCRSRIPASVVVRAWHRELQLHGTEEGFFRFSWRSGVWLGYGLSNGAVRGVYCPTHCAERAGRRLPEPMVGQHDLPQRPAATDRRARMALH
jgi:hypothetical protein